jgi:antirestriction protein ArdC
MMDRFEEFTTTLSNSIIQAIESGKKLPWQKPWKASTLRAYNFVSNHEFTGLNAWVMMLSPFSDPRWATFDQWRNKNCSIKKGEKATYLFKPNFKTACCGGFMTPSTNFCSKCSKRVREDNGSVVSGAIKLTGFSAYAVFNAEQLKESLPPLNDFPEVTPTQQIQKILGDCKEVIKNISIGNSDKACYIPSEDKILLPAINTFISQEAFASTLLHEVVHATGSKDRLNRKGIANSSGFGSESYAFEELIAEIGAAICCHHYGIEKEDVDINHIAYVQSWVKILKNDKTVIKDAMFEAIKAGKYIFGEG